MTARHTRLDGQNSDNNIIRKTQSNVECGGASGGTETAASVTKILVLFRPSRQSTRHVIAYLGHRPACRISLVAFDPDHCSAYNILLLLCLQARRKR